MDCEGEEEVINVVSATIIRSGRIFLTQRRWDQSYAYRHESPGGKVKPGESHYVALHRELNEELEWGRDMAAPTIAGKPFLVSEFARSDKRDDKTPIMLHFYRVQIQDNVWPISREGNGSGWHDEHVLRHLPLLPGNETALFELIDMMRQSL